MMDVLFVIKVISFQQIESRIQIKFYDAIPLIIASQFAAVNQFRCQQFETIA